MKKMKKLAALLLALAMTLALCACGQQAGTPSAGPSDPAQTTPASDPTSEPSQGGEPAGFTTIQEGKLVMSTNAAFPPYEMTSDGEGYKGTGYEGIDVEVAGAIAEKLGLELVIDDMGFDPALLAVQEGQSDIAMAGISITEDRLKVMDFSDSYATGALAIMDLVSGKIDAVIIDNEPAKAYIAQNPGLKILEAAWVEEEYAIGFAKGNDALREAVNAAVAELKADGTFQGIVDKYIKAG